MSHQKQKLQDAPVDQRTKLELEQSLIGNSDCFAEYEHQLGTTPLITMSIDTGDHPPVAKRPYTLALKHHDWVKAEIDKLLEAGVIRESDSSWSAPIVIVSKGDGGKRLCIDFRALNSITITFIWPIPKVEDILAKSESLDDDRVSSCCVALSIGMILSYPCILRSESVTSCPFFDCEGLARPGALSVAGLPVLEVEGVESAVVFVSFDGIVLAVSVVFLFFADECGPDS